MDNQQKSILIKKGLAAIAGVSLCFFLGSFMIQNRPAPDSSSTDAKSFQGDKKLIKAKRPNILWITTEGVPLKVLSCYGSQLIQTPNIDRIAREGMLFRNSFCTNALCALSRASLLTGKYDH